MSDITIFNNELFGSVRTMSLDEKFYFVGKDVAEALGYKDPSSTISKHCKHPRKTTIEVPCQNGNVVKTQVSLIPESDVYRLIIKSKLPEAEKFEEWVMEEVLPQLRQCGVYITETATKESIDYQKLYGKTRIYNTFMTTTDIEAEYNRFFELSKAERKARHINNDVRIACSKLIQKAITERIANSFTELPASKLLAMRELSERIQVDITKLSNKANGGFKAHMTKQLKFMEIELIESKAQCKTLEEQLDECKVIQEQGADAELIEIDYYGFSNNAMYDYSGDRVHKTHDYNCWINHFPTHTIAHLSEEVDFNKPMACELYFDHDKRFDVHNFIKPMLDMISRATQKDDRNIRKVSCVTNEFVNDHRREGKIYLKLYNIELN